MHAVFSCKCLTSKDISYIRLECQYVDSNLTLHTVAFRVELVREQLLLPILFNLCCSKVDIVAELVLVIGSYF